MKQFVLMLTLACALIGASVAQANPITFVAHLKGASEAPVNTSPGIGSAVVIFDTDLHTLSIEVAFSGLLGVTTAAHIHCCTAAPGEGTAGVATQVPVFVAFPLGVNSGSYQHTFDMTQASSFNPAFVAAHGSLAQAELDLLSGSFAGGAYLNLHTNLYPSGEIRGFLAPVPEPDALVLLGLGLLMIGYCRRRRAAL